MSINLVPEARGVGAGSALLTRWQQDLREASVPGCYLQTLVENQRAIRFFSRHGFAPYGPDRDVPGVRYRGRPVHQRDMVWAVPDRL